MTFTQFAASMSGVSANARCTRPCIALPLLYECNKDQQIAMFAVACLFVFRALCIVASQLTIMQHMNLQAMSQRLLMQDMGARTCR